MGNDLMSYNLPLFQCLHNPLDYRVNLFAVASFLAVSSKDYTYTPIIISKDRGSKP